VESERTGWRKDRSEQSRKTNVSDFRNVPALSITAFGTKRVTKRTKTRQETPAIEGTTEQEFQQKIKKANADTQKIGERAREEISLMVRNDCPAQ